MIDLIARLRFTRTIAKYRDRFLHPLSRMTISVRQKKIPSYTILVLYSIRRKYVQTLYPYASPDSYFFGNFEKKPVLCNYSM